MFLRKSTALFLIIVTALAVVSCSDDSDDVVQPGDPFASIIETFGLESLGSIPYPPDNGFNAQRIALGQLLFFDPILGGESAPWIKSAAGKDPYRYRANDVACATCHHPTLGFADGRNLGAGVSGAQFNDMDLGPQRVVPGPSLVTGDPVGAEPRNSPSILNAAFNGKDSHVPVWDSFQFMDGRVEKGLDEQATFPITSRDEMAGDAYGPDFTQEAARDSVTERIKNIPEYVARFKQAFPADVTSADDITIEIIGKAIGAYEREIITPGSRYDQFIDGNRDVFTAKEKEGFDLFFGKALCGDCHSGPMLSDFTFRVQGVGDAYEIPDFEGKNGEGGDFGRFHADEIELADQKFGFRTQTVRNAELTGPYFHSGSAGSLRDLMDFYNRGGLGPDDISNETLEALGIERDPSIRPLGLTDAEMDAVIAFMKTTTAPVQAGPSGLDLTKVPERVPSGLLPPGIPTPNKPGPYLPGDEAELD
ncbi:MAG: hypothetical protein HKN21_04865 [Candidatus Eisenbacteria bacterium]|uniref:Cytochrome c domain-containing protein n=1 Tax=Eiseniibacteriota bacterium TaxID=2212470 RepID=A0A7Y2E7G4_UNCEI|nr:hypothetical protein [Candidatus Eisenbacteria bacterium]